MILKCYLICALSRGREVLGPLKKNIVYLWGQ